MGGYHYHTSAVITDTPAARPQITQLSTTANSPGFTVGRRQPLRWTEPLSIPQPGLQRSIQERQS